MKTIFKLFLVSVAFMTIGSLLAIPNIIAGVYTYKDIFGNLVLGDLVACGVFGCLYFLRFED